MDQLHVRAKEFNSKIIVRDVTAGCLANVWQPIGKTLKKSISPHTLYSLDQLFHLCVCVAQQDICHQKIDLDCRIIQ